MQSIWRDSLIYFLSIIFHRALNFILVLLFVSGLSKSEYGTYELYISILTLFSMIISLELAQGCGRLINEVNDFQKNILFSMSIYSISFLGLVFFFISTIGLIDSLWVHLFSEKHNIKTLLYASANVAFFALFAFFQIQLRWEFRKLQYVIASLIPLFLFLLVVLYCVIFLELTVHLLLFLNLLMNIFGCLICVYFFRSRFVLGFKIDLFINILKISLPFIPASILLIAILITDRFMIDFFLDRSQVGEYSFAYRVSNIAILAFAGIQSALSPLTMKHHTSRNFQEDFDGILHIFLTYSHIFLFGLLLLIPSFLNHLSSFEAYSSSLGILIYLVPALFLSQIYVFLPGPVIAKKTSLYIYVNLISFLTNIFFNFFLIPKFGLFGAAISTLLTYFIYCISLILFSRKFFLPSVNRNFFITLIFCWLIIFLLWFMPQVQIYKFSSLSRTAIYFIFSMIVLRASGFSPMSFLKTAKNLISKQIS